MDKLQINVQIKYGTLICGVILTIVAMAAYWKLGDAASTGILIMTLMQIFGFGIAITALIYTAMNLHLSIEHQTQTVLLNRRKMANEMITRWTSSEMRQYTTKVRQFWQDNKDTSYEAQAESVMADPCLYMSVTAVLDFFEQIALAIRFELADEKLLHDGYTDALKKYWTRFRPLIMRLREEAKSDGILCELESLARKWDLIPSNKRVEPTS